MKPFVFLPLLLLSLLSSRAAITPPPSGWVTFVWEYESAYLETNLVFRLYESTNITRPVANWTMIASINGIQALGTNTIGTNLISTLRLPVQVTPGAHFFSMTASNFWGSADFSNVVSTPALPRDDVQWRVERANLKTQ
jgi:hypothetical protein